ncbi:MAG: DUF3578 domain-containing protein [Treponema sp.]|uniref:MrcB family domain-containing protein n=1 Tax=Treponema sp. TaxID=166 RepID=UPI00298DF3D2|nr:DUF3578 domain-containing protein [Treponema sp.]MBR5932991.1 DUF3578 domain-containing protein [Treponema sp.]
MRSYLESIFKLGYTQYKGLGTSNGGDVLMNFRLLEKEIQTEAKKFGMVAEFKNGSGRWTAVPYLRVFYKDLFPSAQYGIYIVYLFAASGKSVFVTLNQGTSKSTMEEIASIKNKIQQEINPQKFLVNTGSLNIGDDKGYGEAAIFYKEYNINSLPSDDEMKEDLGSLINIYKECNGKGLLGGNSEGQSIIDETPVKKINSIAVTDFKLSAFINNYIHVRYIKSLLTKPFVILTGNSGTGKTRIATRFAEYLEKKNDSGFKNHLLIPVGADWTDNTKILGFYNPLKKEYQSTPVLDFILLADQNPDIPFFLILDEMNLSHVERYFSDFLSAMESGEPIPLYKKDDDCESSIPEEIVLPDNLFVTGTVNIDETTYMFSPKVLDRANVIEFKPEMSDVLENLVSSSENASINPAEPGVAEGFMKLADEVRSGNIPNEVEPVLKEMKPIFEAFYKELEKYGFEFAYRTVKEIRLYTIAAWLTAEGTKPTATEIVDVQILQKILPKIHGNRKQIGELLDNLEKLCTEKELNNSLSKIHQMKDCLNRFQYASFI